VGLKLFLHIPQDFRLKINMANLEEVQKNLELKMELSKYLELYNKRNIGRKSVYMQDLLEILKENSTLRKELDELFSKLNKNEEIKIRKFEELRSALYFQLVKKDIEKRRSYSKRGERISRFLNQTLTNALKRYIKDEQDNLYVSS